MSGAPGAPKEGSADRARRRREGYTAGALAVLLWAAWIAAARVSVAPSAAGTLGVAAPFSALDVAFLRNLGPAILLAPVWVTGTLRESFAPSAAPLWTLPALCAWGAPFAVLMALGLARSDTVLGAALAPGLMPLIAALLAIALLGAWPSRARWAGLALMALGLSATLSGRLASGGVDGPELAGAPLIAGAAAAWALYAVAFPRSGLSPARAAGLVGAWSALIAGAAILLGAESRLGALGAGALFAGFLTHGVFAGVVSVVAFSLAIDRLGAGAAASLAALVPGLAALIGWGALGEAPSAWDGVGLLLASLGVWLVNRARA